MKKKLLYPFSFMDTANEWHSFVIGYFEGLCLFIPALIRGQLPSRLRSDSEYWYYSLGRGIGFWDGILGAIGIAKLLTVVF